MPPASTAPRTLARIQEQDVKDRLLKNTEASVARGTFGAPTFFVGDEIFFGKDKLRDVEEEIEAAKKSRLTAQLRIGAARTAMCYCAGSTKRACTGAAIRRSK